MSPIQEMAIKLISSLPEDSTWEDLQYHLYVIEKVERGEKEIEEGRGIPHEEAKRRMDQWARSNGLLPP